MDQPEDGDLPDDFKIGVAVVECDVEIRMGFVRKVRIEDDIPVGTLPDGRRTITRHPIVLSLLEIRCTASSSSSSSSLPLSLSRFNTLPPLNSPVPTHGPSGCP
jgi:hypothetical protein